MANELGYVPNYSARRLVTSRSDTIGIFFSDLETGTSASFLTEVIEQAQRMLPKQYSLSINSIRTAWESGKVSVSNFDGVIVISQSREDQQFIDQIKQQGIPTVILNRKVEGGTLDNYAFNDFLGEQMATEYAIRMGHRKFALIKGVNSFESSYQRTMGFQKALANHQIEIDPAMIKEGDYFPESGNRLMRQILSSGQVPTCVICENDDMAIGALNACSDLGYRVPEDISLIGSRNDINGKPANHVKPGNRIRNFIAMRAIGRPTQFKSCDPFFLTNHCDPTRDREGQRTNK